MRTSLSFASSSLAVLVLSAAALVACGGETTSLGSQGNDVGSAGASGSSSSGGAGGSGTAGTGGSAAGTGGSTAGAGGSDPIACDTKEIICKEDETKALDLNGCQTCVACPAVTEFAPDGCPENKIAKRYGEDGCQIGWKCALPDASCPEFPLPAPDTCPSGGFDYTYDAKGCIESFTCVSCHVVGDPSYCSDGTITVAIKDGKCDYNTPNSISCVPCAAAAPPEANWCNDGALIVKDADGKCLDAAECSCPDLAACPPNAKSVAIPGSFCGKFVCNDVSCPNVTPPAGVSCDGNFSWERDDKGCVTTLVCNAPK